MVLVNEKSNVSYQNKNEYVQKVISPVSAHVYPSLLARLISVNVGLMLEKALATIFCAMRDQDTVLVLYGRSVPSGVVGGAG